MELLSNHLLKGADMDFQEWFECFWEEHNKEFIGPPNSYERMAKVAWKASRYYQKDCTCPEGGPGCAFFDIVNDECMYGKI